MICLVIRICVYIYTYLWCVHVYVNTHRCIRICLCRLCRCRLSVGFAEQPSFCQTLAQHLFWLQLCGNLARHVMHKKRSNYDVRLSSFDLPGSMNPNPKSASTNRKRTLSFYVENEMVAGSTPYLRPWTLWATTCTRYLQPHFDMAPQHTSPAMRTAAPGLPPTAPKQRPGSSCARSLQAGNMMDQ